jgi:AbrB family looped-hinge helix DNA binding protein
MTTVTVSPKYQVVIPLQIRENLDIHPGQKVQVLAYKGRIEFILLRKARDMRGFLPGIDTAVPREIDRT